MFFSRVGSKAPLVAAVACQALLAGVQSVSACGLDWRLPTNHFDGVDAHGHISYWERIGEVDCGDGLSLPLQINFNSSRDTGASSPYLGQGWLLPLLESKFVQDSEDHFHMVQPDGYNNRFIRDKSDETVLNGSAGWKGQINGETITAWAACGWKIMFAKGRITSMTTPKGRQLDWVYEGGRVSELREGSITRLKVEYGPTGQATALALPEGKRIVITEEKKPQIQTIAGQNVIAGVENSLGTLTLADGQKRSFVFATNEQMLPTLRIEGQSGGNGGVAAPEIARLLSWNPQTKMAARDGDWIYQVAQNADPKSGDAAISRTDSQGRKAYWFNDKTNGQETMQGVDGVKEMKVRFVSGALAGRLRRIETNDHGSVKTKKFSYDEVGHLIKEIDGGHTILNTYADNRLVKIATDSEPPTSITYNLTKDGYNSVARRAGEVIWQRSVNHDGRVVVATMYRSPAVKTNGSSSSIVAPETSAKATSVKTFVNGALIEEKRPDGDVCKYDTLHRLVQHNHSNHETYYHYSTDGQITSAYRDGLLQWKSIGAHPGEKPVKIEFTADGVVDRILDGNGEYIDYMDPRFAVLRGTPTP